MSDRKSGKTDLTKLRKRKRMRKFIYFTLLTFIFLYIPIVLLASGGARADISVIGNGVISDYMFSEGLVIRDEQYIYLPFEGVFTKEAAEGERVPSGYKAATVVDEAYAVKFIEMERLGREILERKKSNSEGSGIFTRDLRLIEERISECIGSIASITNEGSLRGVEEILSKVKEFSVGRDEIITGSAPADTYTEDLVEQYEVLRKSISDKMHEIYTVEPGYISYEVDGLETVLTPEIASKFTVGEMQSAIKEPGKLAVEDKKAAARLIKGNSYMLAFIFDDKQVEKLKARGSAKIEIEGLDITVSAKNIEFGESEGGKTCVYFEINEKLGELASVRKINVKVVFYEYKGLMVPIKSLVNMDAYPIRKVELAKVQDNWIHFIEVDVVAKNNTYAIIESPDNEISLYDSYATKPDNLTEGQVVR